MNREIVYNHRYHSVEMDCSSITAQAFVPHVLSVTSIDTLVGHTFNLYRVASVVAEELRVYGLDVCVVEKRNNKSSSHFFAQIGHAIRHDGIGVSFIGGIVAVEKPNEDVDHMVAITAFHQCKGGMKVTIVDAAPYIHGKPLIRRVPVSWLDRHTIPLDGFGPNAIALFAYCQ